MRIVLNEVHSELFDWAKQKLGAEGPVKEDGRGVCSDHSKQQNQ
jgi:hypothetical protein